MRPLVLALFILAAGLAACDGGPTPLPTSAPSAALAPTSQALPTPSPAPTPNPAPALVHAPDSAPVPTLELTQIPGIPLQTATQTPAPAPPGPPPPVADLLAPIDGDTRWRDLYDTLGRHEQDCIRDSLGAGLLPMVKGELVSISAFEWTQEWQVLVFNCLDPETGRAILLFDMVAGFFDDELPSVGEMDCLMGVAADTHPTAVIVSLLPDSGDRLPMGEFWAGFVKCIPDRFIAESLAFGDESEFLDDEATECLLQAIADLDGVAIALALTEETASDSGPDDPFGPFVDCFVHLWAGSNGQPEKDVEDDHSDEIEGATPVKIGESAPGSVDYETDRDLFVVETREGETYRFDVAPGTLKEPGVTLFNVEFYALADNGDSGGLAPGVTWQAPVSGVVYIDVYGWDLGTYSLTVKVADDAEVEDDHSNTRGGATLLTVGQDIPGKLDYDTDADIFRLDASEGTIYEVVASLETLEYLDLELRDAQWRYLESGYGRDEPGAMGFSWRAPAAADYYVVVRGFEAGSYILSSGAIEDDNRDSSEEATPIEVGQVVPASIYNEEDLDYFVFQSNQGSVYRIVVELGSLKDSALTLYDRRGEIAFNEDFGDSYASRILWEAPDSGTYWLSVSGYESGTYTLVVEEFTPGN